MEFAMLAITRRPGESIVIELPSAEQTAVAVARIRGEQARMAIDAPEHVPVVRSELLESLIS
jgi:carbon storage regulator CsrA